MRPVISRALRTTTALLVLPLLLTACAGAEQEPASSGTDAAATAAAPAAPLPSSAVVTVSPTPAADDAQVVSLTVAGGKVTGDTGRVPVEQGERVRVVVTSDVVDEIHVHGYDLHQDTAAGQAVELEFVADRPGVFEVELEESRVLLTRLQVR